METFWADSIAIFLRFLAGHSRPCWNDSLLGFLLMIIFYHLGAVLVDYFGRHLITLLGRSFSSLLEESLLGLAHARACSTMIQLESTQPCSGLSRLGGAGASLLGIA